MTRRRHGAVPDARRPAPRRALGVLGVMVLAASGCGVTQISLAPPLPKPAPAVAGGGSVAVSPRAEGMPETVGYGTVSLFAIPATPVRFGDGDAARRIMVTLRECLSAAGYTPVDATTPAREPVLTCAINDMRFKNYTWLWPAARTWGVIRLTLTLTTPSGRVGWRREYEERYGHTGASSSFNLAVNATLGKILARATHDFAADEFRAACCSVPRAASSEDPER